MKFTFVTIQYEDISIDFQKVYDIVKADLEEDGYQVKDKWVVSDHFCTNVNNYIEKIFNYRVDCNDEMVKEYNEDILDSIIDEFND